MATLEWGAPKDRRVEFGLSRGVLYPKGKTGVVWNGLTAVSESPQGGEEVSLYADNIKYGSFRSFEYFDATIEAYNYPEEFSECDGSRNVSDGVKISQQKRLPFDFCYRTEVVSSGDSIYDEGYKLHLIYNATAAPTQRSYETVNDSPDATVFSWNLHCNPFVLNGHRASSTIVLDSTKVDRIKMEAIEAILYGTNGNEPRMPDPDEIVALLTRLDLHRMFLNTFGKSGKWVWDTFNFFKDTVPIAIDREADKHIYNEPAQGTQYIVPSIAYSLISEDKNGRRKYMVIVVDNKTPSSYAEALKSELALSGEEVIRSGDIYYHTYTTYV